MTTAWYTPSSSPLSVGRSSAPEEEDGGSAEFEGEILASVEYVCKLIDQEVERGVELKRIAVGGFSQGCAIALLAGLASRYGGRVAGVVGLSGYLPRGEEIRKRRQSCAPVGEGAKMKVFLAHGTKDILVPMRVFRDCKARVANTVGEDVLEAHEYEGMGHSTCGAEFRDMCAFLEAIIPV